MAFPQPTYQTAAPLEALAGTVERVTYITPRTGSLSSRCRPVASVISLRWLDMPLR